MWKWIYFYSFAVLLGIVLAIFEWPFWVAMVILMICSIAMIGNLLFILYGTTNMKKVERLIISKKKEPIYRYIYSQGFETTEEQIEAIDAILHKYKQPHLQHYYRAAQLLLKENFGLALEEANNIKKEPLMNYMKALIFAYMGNEEQALTYQFDKQWMQEAIRATVAHYKKDALSFEQHADQAISSARGMQRLSLIYSFKQMGKSSYPES